MQILMIHLIIIEIIIYSKAGIHWIKFFDTFSGIYLILNRIFSKNRIKTINF